MAQNNAKDYIKEVVMGNGNIDASQTALQLLAKHGPWAFWSCVLGAVVWFVTLEPLKNERAMLLKTFDANATASQRVAESTEEQACTLKGIKEEVVNQTALRETAMSTMNSFASDMRAVMEEIKKNTITSETRKMLEEFVKEARIHHPDEKQLLKEIKQLLEEQNDAN